MERGWEIEEPAKTGPVVPWLYCSDLDRSLGFYRDVLGFQLRGARPEEKSAYIEHHGARIMLQEATAGSLLLPDLEHPFGRGVHLLIATSNVDALHMEVLNKASHPAVYADPRNRWYRIGEGMEGHREIVLQDPDGYLLRFYQRLEGLEGA